MARPRTANPDTRTRILAAASDEFGAHGFAATTVDRIARRARVNKAMIYYHFPNKRALYTCIIRDVFAPITERLARRSGRRRAAGQQARPPHRCARAIRSTQSTHFLPIFLREIADGGAHLGPEELGADRRHLCDGQRRHRRGRRAEGVPARPPRARALHDHRAARDVPRDRARSRADQDACGMSKFPTRTPPRSCDTCRWSRNGCWRRLTHR